MHPALVTISNSSLKKNLPQFRAGQTVRIHQRIKEGEKERVQVFEGIIIKMNNGTGINGTITVRKVVDGIGVERVFAIHSPLIAKIEVTKQAKVRRSKLYFLRDRTGKAARLRTTLLEGQVFEPTSAVEEEASVEGSEETPETDAPADLSAPVETEIEAPVEEVKAEEAPATEAAPEAPADFSTSVETEKDESTDTPAEEVKEEVKTEEAPAAEAPVEEAKEDAPAEEAKEEEKTEEA
jgi:large subunit ribosomal protein L19